MYSLFYRIYESKKWQKFTWLDSCFEDLDNPIELFKKWFSKAEETEINDPNAVAVATSDKNNQPNVRMVLLKRFK
jgi:pyridoxamine 5'-phosphate oxidase